MGKPYQNQVSVQLTQFTVNDSRVRMMSFRKAEVLNEMIAFVQEQNEIYPKKQVDQDGLWKMVIGELFEEFIGFFMPELHEAIDFE